MNNAVFAGRVGSDAVLNYTKSGKAVADFSIAIDNGKDQDGNKRNATWIKAVLWEKKAEALAQYIKKGISVVVSGPVSTEAWISKKTSEAESKVIVTVRDFTFGGGSGDSSGAGSPGQQEAKQQRAAVTDPRAGSPISDEDIPF